MILQPDEIKRHKFSKAIRGFDPVEVEAFLEIIADNYEKIISEYEDQKEKISEYESNFQEFEINRDNFKREQLKVTKELESLKGKAKKEAKIIIADAKLRSDNIISNAYKEVSRLRQEIDELKMIKSNFITRLKKILRQQIETIEIYENK